MEEGLLRFATRFRPELPSLVGRDRASGIADIFAAFCALPMAVAGIVWLIAATDPTLFQTRWPTLAIVFVLTYLFERLDFFFAVEVDRAIHASTVSTASDVVIWSAALMYGPGVLWVPVFWGTVGARRFWNGGASPGARWSAGRIAAADVAGATLPSLAALALYGSLGGRIPLPNLTVTAIAPAVFATLARAVVVALIEAPLVVYYLTTPLLRFGRNSRRAFMRFVGTSMLFPLLVALFAILAAGLHAIAGLGAYLYFIAGALLASVLAHRLSGAVDESSQRTRELERLDQLGHAILEAPPDGQNLGELLEAHAADMFAFSQIEVRLFPDQMLLSYPESSEPVPEEAWEWLATTGAPRYVARGDELPWGERSTECAYVMAPILDAEILEPLGGVVVRRRPLGADPARQLPAVQSLAAEIGSALHGARVYERTLEHQLIDQELAVAAGIQASFMPRVAPDVPGWEFRAIILPAREASGDFIDLFPLAENRWGILIADVSGKGLPAAIYMVLSRTLIRTYAYERAGRPDSAITAANERILLDTDDEFFVTAFYGLLDTSTGLLRYCNAGHNPPYLIRASRGGKCEELEGTGIPLGMLEDTEWEEAWVEFGVGDMLLLYTDGVIDAENEDGKAFGEERLLEVARANVGRPAPDIRDALSTALQDFVGDAPRVDDITLMIVVREGPSGEAV
jgi:serine phosphatase RsbU (regulator of sigma subunit)